MKKLALLLMLALGSQGAFAQLQTVKGTVVDQANEPVTGATVSVNGTKKGAVTDADGNFIINDVPAGAKVTISYLGMKTATLAAAAQMSVTLSDDSKMLDEVVAIGYGSAKVKDLTSPIVVVRGEQLLSTPSSSPMAAMQGKVAGVNVVNSGVPGAGPTVRVRGTGSFANSNPLYVVDGMFYDNINFLNSEDIEDMSVLKDASAAAIYGVRAANGVVIITTRKGQRNQKAQITYDGYIGTQQATNVLKMANSSQYAQMLMEADYNAYNNYFKQSINRYGGSYADADFHNWTYGSNTNWYDELLRKAVITNHSINISGGSDRATYTLGVNYLYQNGIMKTDNDYKRLNFRARVDYDATSWLTVGFNGMMSKANQQFANNAAWQQAFNAPGIYPVYDENNTLATPVKFASPGSVGFTNNFYNPVATATYYDNTNRTSLYNTSFYALFKLLPEKLSFKTSINYDHTSTQAVNFTPKYYISQTLQTTSTYLSKSMTDIDNYIWDNTLQYNDSWGKHTLGAMAGFSMREENSRYLMGARSNVPAGKDEYKYIGLGDENSSKNGDSGSTYRGMSYFGRLNYSYADKYLLMLTMRADGSSKYQEHWGYFPSIGTAWVVSEEPWMKDVKGIDYLKLRASWGALGNDHVAASDGFASISTGNNTSGVFGNNIYPGYQNNSYFSYLKWERVEEFNLGFNLATLKNRLNIDVDYFHRLTKNAVVSPQIAFDNRTLAGNYGRILNHGFDVSATWNDCIGQNFKYHFGTNLSFIHNKVKALGGQVIIKNGKTVNWVRHEMNSFYGYVVEGIYQNAAEIAADPTAVLNGLEPGDFKYKDLNGDGKIDGNDRTTLGSYQPNFIYGANLGFEWKGIDFELTTYGQAGAQMFNRKRALRYAQSNYNFDEAQYKDRWTGEGSTNSNPSAKALIKGWNVSDQRVNSYFVESANYFRIQNITLGYSFKNIRLGSYTLPGVRLSLTADRPLTVFQAHAFTPELTDAQGWDTQVYPLTATYTLGVQFKF